MTTPQLFVATAAAEIGYTESPRGSNRTKYGQWYGLNGEPWCSIFVAYCAARVGQDVRRLAENWAYTPSALDGLRKRGMTVPNNQARAGDIVFFDFPPRDRTQHVGIIESASPQGLVTIEGNTGVGNDANGGAVMRRQRRWADVTGIGRLNWAPAPQPPAPIPAQIPQEDDDMAAYIEVTAPADAGYPGPGAIIRITGDTWHHMTGAEFTADATVASIATKKITQAVARDLLTSRAKV